MTHSQQALLQQGLFLWCDMTHSCVPRLIHVERDSFIRNMTHQQASLQQGLFLRARAARGESEKDRETERERDTHRKSISPVFVSADSSLGYAHDGGGHDGKGGGGGGGKGGGEFSQKVGSLVRGSGSAGGARRDSVRENREGLGGEVGNRRQVLTPHGRERGGGDRAERWARLPSAHLIL